MADAHSPDQRRRNMAAIRSIDTAPELTVRRLLHRLGYRYVLHRRSLPGRPDLTFPSRRKIIFVHGCFWHMHDCRRGVVVPSTRTSYWQAKRRGNVERDSRNVKALEELGYRVFVVWECETRREAALREMLEGFLVE